MAVRFALLILTAAVAKPLRSINESINEMNHDASPLKDPFSLEKEERISALPTNDEAIATSAAANSTAGTVIDEVTARPVSGELAETTPTSPKPGPLSWFLLPLTQKIQFSPQSFLQDRLVQLKEVFNSLGIAGPPRWNATAKQLGPGSLVHFVGSNEPDFYTNRLEPAGFFSGNGWFANKGGILGGPGAIVSTGSLLTDYPSPYRKK